ncbi:MAG: ABC transporter permease [Acidobacteria bacterium]|nr:MAG: ABC transporter permease [Acidobacteriota bacterium]
MSLFRTIILRHLWKERLRTLTTIVGIAMGIALIVAVRLTNASSVRGFQAALELVSGRTSLEIVGAGGSFDEQLLQNLQWLREYGDVSPVIDGEVVVLGEAGRSDRLRLLGIDVLREPPFREYTLSGSTVASGTRDFLNLLTDPHAVILTEKFAGPRGLKRGDLVRLSTGDRVQTVTIQGLLKDDGPARVLDGHLALMDIAAAQVAVNRLGLLDRLDLRLSRSRDVGDSATQIAGRLPPGLHVQRPSERTEHVEKMLEAFHLNLEALSYVALLVGLFLIYNTVSVSVIARREEIGMLRALGVSRQGIQGLFLGEAALLTAVGCVGGILAGRLLAYGTIELTRTTVQTLYVATAAAPPQLTIADVALALALGVPLALLAGVLPAREAATVPPIAAVRGPDLTRVLGPRHGPGVLAAVGVLILAALLARQPAIDGRPVFGWASAVLIVLSGALLVPIVLRTMTTVLWRLLRWWFQLEGWLATANLSAGIGRIAISVAALAMSLSMMVAVAVMIGSFRDTVEYWTGETLAGDLYVSSATGPDRQPDFTIAPEVVQWLRQHPGVAAVDVFRRESVVYQGAPIGVAFGQYATLLDHGNLVVKSPDNWRAALRQAIGQNAVIVTEPFAIKHGHDVGDEIELPTSNGPALFRIAGVYFDYSSDRGMVVFDRSTFVRYFGDRPPTSLTVYLRQGYSADTVRNDALTQLGNRHRVFIRTNESLRREVLRIFDSTFAITYALEAVAIIVAMMGVATTLLTLTLDRRRDLAVLRLIGTARRQIVRMVVAEALMIAGVSQAIGLAVGMALSLVLVFVINRQSFGWTIQWHVPWLFLGQMSLLTVLATMASALLPARRAARTEFVEQLADA